MKNIKKNESGRSMVEMLAVLAIIGVLSIGGIAGYVIAMTRWRANEVLDLASKLHVIAISKDGGEGDWADQEDLNVPLGSVAGGIIAGISANPYGEVIVSLKPDQANVGKTMKSIAGDDVVQSGDGSEYEMTIIFDEYED
ncbi:MAG: hypothetical protein LBU87_00275 [Lactobacillales bacterium]|nr:hypothetical protein [Lactobacillales bacterium]